jgi:PDZ domain-containing protein
VALKTQAAKRDGATVFLVPKEECADAKAELPKGLRLIPVTSLKGAVSALTALESGKGSVPAC